jgi:hypothetical protein
MGADVAVRRSASTRPRRKSHPNAACADPFDKSGGSAIIW